MSGEIQLTTTGDVKDIAVHVLPCHIAYDGPSKVSQFFKPRVDPNDEIASTSTFRGRKLCGRSIKFPNKYVGKGIFSYGLKLGRVYHPSNPVAKFDRTIYGEEDDEDEEDEAQKGAWQAGEKFDSLTVWQHHQLPDAKQEHWIRGIEEWIAMAEVVRD